MPTDPTPATPDSPEHSSLTETKHVDALYGDWFLDYASYVILERAVPHLYDGLKPVQRRIMHSLRELEDGRYNKVANVVGNTMKYHPHGDASIGDAMVQIGQKELLIDTQGNWGNILTGDNAAAARYIEARLSKFALDVVFSPKVTHWASSYDGRNKEPVTLPVKFPLLLAQGVEGIAVGLSCRILPHNFIELIDASIAALRGETIPLFPDFIQGGIMDAADYNDGKRGGKIRVRARIEPGAKKNILRITEIPFSTTAGSIQDSIVAANDKGKIKIAKVEDNTAEFIEILVHLVPGADPDQTIQALYAFTDCEISISVNAVVIHDNKPRFISVTELVQSSAEHSKDLLKRELEIQLQELEEKWHFSSLEKIFIEKRIYRDIEEATTWDAVIGAIWRGLTPYLPLLKREVTEDDIVRLTEIRIKRISKFNTFEANEYIRGLEDEIDQTNRHLKQLTRYAIAHFERLKKQYSKGRERRTEIAGFDRVAASQVAMANEILYLDAKEGFAGYGLKKEGEPLGKCSTMDEILFITKDGTLSVTKVAPKFHVGKNPTYIDIFKRDEQAVYSLIYRDGKQGRTYAKRFRIGGITRDKEYPLTQSTPGTKILYFQRHETEEESNAQTAILHLQPKLYLRNLVIDYNFSELAIKGRESKGNLVTANPVDRVVTRRVITED
ncbi:DNA gyrase/topoisomerase IV subunit A [Phragmitibacter flavus]|uniref:DNA gyrase/topoisomerase IV subunit A n=1 Tax=Phragmitibacter flavus TaxID=2576071 RepID=A0A5R8KBX7_9BACT|nr:DNA gyrase/topoisomerase IV subunit A [Phragmitibacter flavus]TLD69820.1 DNA gyrase/topoisomerase IV subunit A [Phragmitibacter flavus]